MGLGRGIRLLLLMLFVTSSCSSYSTTVSTTRSLLLQRLAESQVTDQEAETEAASTTQATPPKVPRPDMYSLHVTSHIEYRFANTLVTSRLANPANTSQEIFFSVVLPETAFISKFLMEIKGKVYEAYVKEKKEAKQEYDQAVASGLGAAHVALSARDSNRFTVSVNIEPMSKVTFNLTYEELLTRRLGAYNHVVNLDPGQVVRDMTVDVFIKESRNISMLRVPELRSGNEVDANELTKSNPLASVSRQSATEAHISFSPTAEQQKALGHVKPQAYDQSREPAQTDDKEGLGGQFVVQYDVDRDPQAGEVLINNGYFVHFFAPTELPALRKHALFVLDVSGSMEGRKIEQLKEAMDAILDDLHEGDYFNIIEFSYSVTVHNLDSVAASAVFSPYNAYSYDAPTSNPGPTPAFPATPEYIAKAKDIVSKMRAGGGTNIYDTLKTVIHVASIGLQNITNATSGEKREPIIVFLTDGEPTVGETRLSKIFSVVQELNSNLDAAIFSLAFGDDADLGFLRKLSLKNSGFARKIYEAGDAALQLRDFYRQIASPLLANVTFNYVNDKIIEEATTKVHFRTLFSGSELVVAGKLRANPNTTSYFTTIDGDISGDSANGSSMIPILELTPIDFIPPVPHSVPVAPEVTPLERLWAYLTIQQLLEQEDRMRDDDRDVSEAEETKVEGGKLSPRRQALDLALKYSFVTSLTSLVVVKPNETKASDTQAVNPVDGDQNFPAPISGNFGPVDRLGVIGFSLPLSSSSQSFARPMVQSYAPLGLQVAPKRPGPPPTAGFSTPRYPSAGVGAPGYPSAGFGVPSASYAGVGAPGAPSGGFSGAGAHSGGFSGPGAPSGGFSGAGLSGGPAPETSRPVGQHGSGMRPQNIGGFGTPSHPGLFPITDQVGVEGLRPEEFSAETEDQEEEEEDSATTETVAVTSQSEEAASLIVLGELDWLKKALVGENVTLPFGADGTDAVYQLQLNNETLTDPAPCKTPSGAQGKCLHLQQCALNLFKTTVDQYKSYFCQIDNFAGACCPDDVTRRLNKPAVHDVTSTTPDVTPTTSSTPVSAK